jgi:hypothetical protein
MSTPFKMKGHTLPGPFQKKIWPPGSKQSNVDDLIEEEKEKSTKKGYHAGKSFHETSKFIAGYRSGRKGRPIHGTSLIEYSGK